MTHTLLLVSIKNYFDLEPFKPFKKKRQNHNLILNYIISIYSSKDCVKEIWMIWTSLHNFDHDRTEINNHNLKIDGEKTRWLHLYRVFHIRDTKDGTRL